MDIVGLGTDLVEVERFRVALRRRATLAERGLNVPAFESQIVPVIIGGNEAAVAFAGRLQREGLLIKPIRPPTVPAGTSRVRLSVNLSMSDQALKEASATIVVAARQAGIVGHG